MRKNYIWNSGEDVGIDVIKVVCSEINSGSKQFYGEFGSPHHNNDVDNLKIDLSKVCMKIVHAKHFGLGPYSLSRGIELTVEFTGPMKNSILPFVETLAPVARVVTRNGKVEKIITWDLSQQS